MRHLILLPLLLMACDPAPAKTTTPPMLSKGRGSIAARIDGIRNDKGEILARLYQGGAGFPSDGSKAYKQKAFKIIGYQVTVLFEDIPYGEYALWICHDEDGDKKLRTNFIGMPKEGVGVSGPPPSFSPSFEKARFLLDSATSRHEITLKYL